MKKISLVMFMRFIFPLFVIVSMAAGFASCKKNTGSSIPVITLDSPADTLIIHAGDTVLVSGTVSDNKSLHEIYFTFKDNANDSIFLYENPYTHGAKAYTFNFIWYPSAPSVHKLTVEVQDHDNHTTKQDFLLTAN